MPMKQWTILFAVVFLSEPVHHHKTDDLRELAIYYDEKNHPVPLMAPSTDAGPSVRMPSLAYGPLPCSCQGLSCSCCFNINIKLTQFHKRACVKLSYSPLSFGINIGVTFNDSDVFTYGFSAIDPPNMCMPVIVPYIQSQVSFCLKVFIIPIDHKNLQLCSNLQTNVIGYPISNLRLSCLQLGLNGITIYRYADNKPLENKTDRHDMSKNANKFNEKKKDNFD